MAITSEKYPEKVDLENCAKEPIHIIGSIQSHGALVACDPLRFTITQVSANTSEFFSIQAEDLLNNPLSALLGKDQVTRLKDLVASELMPQELLVNDKKFIVVPHFSELNLILEFEPVEEDRQHRAFQQQLSGILNKLQNAKTIKNLCRSAAILTKEMFGYDRVMIYKFDEEWNGEVIEEKKEEEMESWLGLHYPATDIPAQSRQLFLTHRVRMISDVHYEPVPIVPSLSPLTGDPVDLSQSELRAVSPIHIEYLINMKVGASLSAAIVVQGKLWGLIACHHTIPKYLSYYQRESCRFLAEILSTRIALRESNNFIKKTETSEVLRNQLVKQLGMKNELFEALTSGPVKFIDLMECGGGALYFKGKWGFSGIAPKQEHLEKLLNDFLSQKEENIFYTRHLSEVFPEAKEYRKSASGLLSLRLSEDKYILWFKPEEIANVTWGGNPGKKVIYDESKRRLSPRKSFKKWREQISGISKPWYDYDRNVARALGENISHLLLARQREEIETLNAQLMEVNEELELFSYGLSHDLRAPVRGMRGYLQIIQEDFAGKLGSEGESLLVKCQELTKKMNALIEDILSYSHFSHLEDMRQQEVSVKEMIQEVLELFNTKVNYPRTKIEVANELPPMKGDRRMLFQLWSNLFNNALKYSSKAETPLVEIGTTERNEEMFYFIKDNGIGIEKEYLELIFDSFSRVAGNEYEGTGIGLAIVNKIIEKHGGMIWVESKKEEGTTFYFNT